MHPEGFAEDPNSRVTRVDDDNKMDLLERLRRRGSFEARVATQILAEE